MNPLEKVRNFCMADFETSVAADLVGSGSNKVVGP